MEIHGQYSVKAIFIFLTIVPIIINGSRIFTVEFLGGNVTSVNSEKFTSVDYKIYDRKTLYAEFMLGQDFVEFELNLNLDVLRKDNHRTNVLNQLIPGCKFLAGAQKANLLKIISREFYRVINFKKCPLLKERLYVIKNYTLKDDDFPVITPIVEWRLKIDIIFDKEIAGILIINGRVRKL